jgi:hypothetical protein
MLPTYVDTCSRARLATLSLTPRQLKKYLDLPQKGNVMAEYVWIDGSNGIRSKSKVSLFFFFSSPRPILYPTLLRHLLQSFIAIQPSVQPWPLILGKSTGCDSLEGSQLESRSWCSVV